MFYEKKIGYLEYRENGEKVHNAGFVKIEVKSDSCNLQIQVSRLPVLDKLTRKIFIQGDKKETCLGEIILQEGAGSFKMRGEDAANLGQGGIRYDELVKVVIVIGTGRELVCNWRKETGKEDLRQKKEKKGEEIKEEKIKEEKIKEEKRKEEERKEERKGEEKKGEEKKEEERKEEERVQGEPGRENQDKERASGKAEEGEKGNLAEDIQAAELRMNDTATRAEERADGNPSDRKTCRSPRRLQLYEDKWKQLSSIYPHITPFYDEREYLSITPADFVVLQRQYHRLVSNSFLLHGFYNYNHLILARVERAGAIRYYVGVPGNFYEKERQIAIMFGFESFECRKEPVGQGDFGYYCIRVDL